MSNQVSDSAGKISSNHLNRQLGLYSFVAAAAGVSMLALAQPAKGEVIVTKKTIPIPFGIAGVGIDMNHDGVNDFRFFLTYRSFSGTSMRLTGGEPVGYFYASALARGAKIGPSANFYPGSFKRIEKAYGGYLNHRFIGYWGGNVKNRYLGVRFSSKGETHYGWIRLTVTIPSDPRDSMTGTITGYAYETVPNKPILAGTAGLSTKAENDSPASGRPSLGMLAAGADGMPLWRREER